MTTTTTMRVIGMLALCVSALVDIAESAAVQWQDASNVSMPQAATCSDPQWLGACQAVLADNGDARCNFAAAAIGTAFTTQGLSGASLGGALARSAPSVVSFTGFTGRFTYDADTSPVNENTLFDMASCSKVLGATTAVAQLYQQGYIDLDAPVATYLGPRFSQNGKGSITVRNLLLHNAGFPPDPTPFDYSTPSFGCPQTQFWHPGQDFSCEPMIYDALMAQTLDAPPGARYVYSDLSMITAAFLVAQVVRDQQLIDPLKLPTGLCQGISNSTWRLCYFYHYVKQHVFTRMGMASTDYVPTSPLRTAPEWQDDYYRHGLIMGYVSDENCYAMGGVSGHAGVFSTVNDVLTFARYWASAATDDPFLNATTVAAFSRQYNATQSSRALGWDTNNQSSPPCGSSLSPQTFFHIGYTGTQICIDPVNGLITILLTNGRYPDYRHDGAIWYRPRFGDKVLAVLRNPPPPRDGGGGGGPPQEDKSTWKPIAGGIAGCAIAVAVVAGLISASRRRGSPGADAYRRESLEPAEALAPVSARGTSDVID